MPIFRAARSYSQKRTSSKATLAPLDPLLLGWLAPHRQCLRVQLSSWAWTCASLAVLPSTFVHQSHACRPVLLQQTPSSQTPQLHRTPEDRVRRGMMPSYTEVYMMCIVVIQSVLSSSDWCRYPPPDGDTNQNYSRQTGCSDPSYRVRCLLQYKWISKECLRKMKEKQSKMLIKIKFHTLMKCERSERISLTGSQGWYYSIWEHITTKGTYFFNSINCWEFWPWDRVIILWSIISGRGISYEISVAFMGYPVMKLIEK